MDEILETRRTIMIQRDYILRMIEELRRVLAAIVALREEGRWQEVAGTVDEQFRRLVGAGASEAAKLSETELTARLMRGEATQIVRDKMLFLVRLFKEAGDAAVAQDRLQEGHELLLKGLELRVGTYWGEEPSEQTDFAPPVEAFTGALADSAIPPHSQVLLMHHYERMGAFAKAEDALHALLEAASDDIEIVDWGILFYERLQGIGDAALEAGNLPRSELDAGLAELKARKSTMRARSGVTNLRVFPNLVLICLSLIGFDSCEQMAKLRLMEETAQTHPLSAGGTVKVESSRGAIVITGWDREEWRVDAARWASDAAELALITLEIDATEDRVSIRATAPPGSSSNPGDGPRIDIRMWVPQEAGLENIAAGRGHVTVQDIAGDVVASSVNGSVLVERSTGDLTLKCVNGRTVALLSTLAMGQRVDLETVNGSTTVVLPEDASAEVSAYVANGTVMSDLGLPITDDFPAGRKMEGRLGAGDATVSARTANGSVTIRKRR